MEEYEPHIAMGSVIYAGVDYQDILNQAETEADVIIWDGGNNDYSFYKPDFTITVADPFRPGHEIGYYPGEVNLRLADVVIINKVNSADRSNVEIVEKNTRQYNPNAIIIKADSVLTVDNPEMIKGKRVLAIEDGPTLTHGEMTTGAGIEAAKLYGAADFVDPRPYVVGKIAETFKKYPNIGKLLPAMGYGDQQMKDLEETINKVDCDAVVIGTPIDLQRFIKINKPATRVRYDLSLDAKETLKRIMQERGLV
jgi:predicted GTPase